MRSDFSTSNPNLHRLYVSYAQEELMLYDEMIRNLNEFSRVNPSIMAGLIHQERANLIKEDAAYREAAWRIMADDLVVIEPFIHGDVAIDDGKVPAKARRLKKHVIK